jgi:hypothetical protein
MMFNFIISPHAYEAGTVYEDSTCHGAYIEVGDDETYEWFQAQGYEDEGNGYTILALVDSLCRLELMEDLGKVEMEAEADNTWVYSREKAPIDRLIAAFEQATADEAGVRRLIENADVDLME